MKSWTLKFAIQSSRIHNFIEIDGKSLSGGGGGDDIIEYVQHTSYAMHTMNTMHTMNSEQNTHTNIRYV